MYPQEEERLTERKPRRAWRWLRAPLIGLALGLAVVKGVDKLRIARLSPKERAFAAREHCRRAQEICDKESARLGVGPINLPREVMGDMVAAP